MCGIAGTWFPSFREFGGFMGATRTWALTDKAKAATAKTDPKAAERLTLFDRRVPEELYNYSRDEDALENLIAKPEHRAERERLSTLLDTIGPPAPHRELFAGLAQA